MHRARTAAWKACDWPGWSRRRGACCGVPVVCQHSASAHVHTLFPLVHSTSYKAAAVGPALEKKLQIQECSRSWNLQLASPPRIPLAHPVSAHPRAILRHTGGRGIIPHTKDKCTDEERGGDRRSQASLSLLRPSEEEKGKGSLLVLETTVKWEKGPISN